MLIKRKSGEASRSQLQALAAGPASRTPSTAAPSSSAPGSRSAASRPWARSSSARCARPTAAAGSARREGRDPEERLHPLLGRLHGHGRGAERRLDRPGAVLGKPDQPRHPLRQGRGVRELVHGDRRLKYPMKLVGGQWQRISWDQAINEIGDKLLEIREQSGADSVYWLGSAKFTNEGAYLFRKFGAFWGTNSVDHQARICHSTTVAGVANTWGYGAQTNSYNDLRNAKTMLILGGNPAEAHPISIQHLLAGKELNRANFIVVDPRFTRTAAHATEYVRLRPGTDIPFLMGMMWHIVKNGWEDKEFIRQRVYGMDQRRQGDREVSARGGRAHHRRARRAAEARRREVRQGEAGDPDLVHGPDAEDGRHRQRARLLHRAAADRQCRQARHRRQHLPRPHQRPGRDRSRPRYHEPAALLRPDRGRLEALGAGLGGRVRVACKASSTRCRRRPAARPATARKTWRRRASPRRAGSTRCSCPRIRSTSAT